MPGRLSEYQQEEIIENTVPETEVARSERIDKYTIADENDQDLTGTLVEELWPGIKVLDSEKSEKEKKIVELLQEIHILKDKYPSESKSGKRAITQEKSSKIDEFSEIFFTDQEKKKWNLEQRNAISGLVINGFLKFDQINESISDRVVIADLDKFKEPDIKWTELLRDMGSYPHRISNTHNQFEIFAQLSQDIGNVVSREDYLNDSYEDEGPLFYVPHDDPLDIEYLKTDKSHLGLWEATSFYPTEYPAVSQENVRSTYEVIPAYYLYSPRKGDAKRDSDGNLIAKWSNGRESKVTGKFFYTWGCSTKFGKNKIFIGDSPVSYLDKFPALVENDLLRAEDFRIRGGEYGYLSSHRLVGKETNEKGMVMIEGIRYTLGVEFGNVEGKKSKFEVTQISQDQYAVVERIPVTNGHRFVVRGILDTYTPEEAKKYVRNSTPYPDVGKRALDKEDKLLDVKTYLEKHPENTPYIDNFQENIEILNQLESNGVTIDTSSLSISEQVELLNFLDSRRGKYWMNQILIDKGLSTIDIESRLKTIIALANNINDLEIIGRVASLGGEAKPLFESVRGIVTSLSTLQDYLRNNIDVPPEKVANSEKIREQIIKYTSILFMGSGELLKAGETNISEVAYILESYNRSVERWCNELFRNEESSFIHTRYTYLLNLYESMEKEGRSREVVSRMIIEYLEDNLKSEILKSRNTPQMSKNLEAIRSFYENNTKLFETASETTGDTEAELTSLKKFFDRYESIDGLVLDVGSGTGERITLPMAKMLEGKAKVVGMDLYPSSQNIDQPNLSFVQGNAAAIPLPSKSVAIANFSWSVTDDFDRELRLKVFDEIGRVMKDGGIVRIDRPYLEGGEGSWFDLAEQGYKSGESKDFGDIYLEFPGGRGKSFHIYPKSEFLALLNNAGFRIKETQVWYTESRKPRITLEAEYTGKANPL
jgi:SAM-dependent methyltransferase